MMENEKGAKLFLSAIIGEKVVELDFSPQERTIRIPKDKIKKQEEEKEKALEENKKALEEKEKANLKKYLEEQAKEIEALKKKMTNNQ
jgi:hypothetical protein